MTAQGMGVASPPLLELLGELVILLTLIDYRVIGIFDSECLWTKSNTVHGLPDSPALKI